MRIRKLSTRLLVAIVTFSIGVAVTMWWVVPRFSTEETVTIPIADIAPNRQDTLLRKEWKKIHFYHRLELMVPGDMKEDEIWADRIHYTKAFKNEEIRIEIIGDTFNPDVREKLRQGNFQLCKRPETITNHPTYKESLLEIDGRQAQLGIARGEEFGGIGATVCFPAPGDPAHEFMIAARCKDDHALAIGMEIFNSITFRK